MDIYTPAFPLSGDCKKPQAHTGYSHKGNSPGPLTRVVRCGDCKNCMAQRWKEWINRMAIEVENSKSAVFVTGTFSDQTLQKVDTQTEEQIAQHIKQIEIRHQKNKQRRIEATKTKIAEKGINIVPADLERWTQRLKEINDEEIKIDHTFEKKKLRTKILYGYLQRFLKRLRERSNVEIRSMPVFEIGNGKTILGRKSSRTDQGNPHYHVLLTFKDEKDITNQDIKNMWRQQGKQNKREFVGFCSTRNIDSADSWQIRYLAKYLGKGRTQLKTDAARLTKGKYVPRKLTPSQHYGEGWRTRIRQYASNQWLRKTLQQITPQAIESGKALPIQTHTLK